MRVLILPAWYPTGRYEIGGVFIQEQARALHNAGALDVAVLFVDRVSMGEWLRGSKVLHMFREEGMPVYRLLMPRIPALWPFLYAAWAVYGFLLVRRAWGRADLLHAHVALPAGLAGAIIGRIWHIPIVLTEHTGPFSLLMRNAPARFATRFAVKSARRMVAVSRALRTQIWKYPQLRRRIDVVPNVVDVEAIPQRDNAGQPASDKRVPRLLFVGEMRTSIKGVDYMLGAVSLLRKRGIEVHLDLVGDGSQRRTYEAMSRRMKIAGPCRFLGTLPHDMVLALMRECDLFVVSSLAETFGVALVEALASGTPVVATRCGGPEEILTPDLGILVDPANSKSLADGIESALAHLDEFSPEHLRESVELRFGRDAVVAQLRQLYSEVVGSPSGKAAKR